MLTFLKPYRVAITVALLLMLTELMVELSQPFLIAKIIDEGIMQGDVGVIWRWGLVLVGFSILAFIAGTVNSFYAAHTSQGFAYDLRGSLFRRIQSFAYADFGRFPTASLVTRLTNDITQLQNMLFMSLRIAMRAPLLIAGGLVMAFMVNVKLALVLAVVIPLLLVLLFVIFRASGPLFRRVQTRLDAVNNVMKENLSGMRLIRVFLRRKHEFARFRQANEELMDGTVRALRFVELMMPLLLLVMNGAILAILWFGSRQLALSDATVGEVAAIVIYATRITMALSIVSMIVSSLARARASAARIGEVLDTPVDGAALEEVTHNEEAPLLASISFEALSFRYPQTPEDALTDIDFHADSGQLVAVMGATGAGKSTLFQLIPRLYEATSGCLRIGGQDVRTLSYVHLRKMIGYVPQEAVLFSGTIRDNIAWGKTDATEAEIVEAAQRAQIHETITRFPEGYNTIVGQRGVNLSGGQKQRLSIARALVRRPAILLLDDSASALDAKTEADLMVGLAALPCTILMITQKISAAARADQVLLLDDGRVLDQGTHEQLQQRCALYQKICQSQTNEDQEALRHA